MTDALKAHCSTLRSEIFDQGLLPEWVEVAGPQVTVTLPFAAGLEARRLIDQDPLLRGYSWTIQQTIETLPRSQSDDITAAAKNVIAVASGKGGVGKSSVSRSC